MAVGTRSAIDDYPTLFRNYVENSIEVLTSDLRADVDNARQIRLRALSVLDFALELPSAWPKTRRLVLTLSPWMEREGYWVEWVPVLARAVAMCRKVHDDIAQWECCLQLGVLYRLLGDFHEASGWFDAALKLADSLSDSSLRARTISRQAQMERTAGHLDVAERLAHEALALYHACDPERARCYTVLGTVTFDRHEWVRAEQFFREALVLCKNSNDSLALAWAYADVATALRGQKRFEEAIAYFDQALALFGQVNATAQESVIHLNLSALYLSMGKPEAALDHCARVAPFFQRYGDQRRLIMTYTNMGIAQHELQRFEQAEHALLDAIRLARAQSVHLLAANALDQLGLLYFAWNREHEGSESFEAAFSLLELVEDDKAKTALLEIFTAHRRQAEQTDVPNCTLQKR